MNLTERMAEACESARRKVCTCRCGGEYHGLNHEPFMRKLIEEEKAERKPFMDALAIKLNGRR